MKLGFQNCFVVDRRGLSGGLALLWNPETDMRILSYSWYHIDVMIEGVNKFRVTLFYGNPKTNLTIHNWNLLRRLRECVEGPWLVIRDFNKIWEQREMYGKRDGDTSQMRRFREALWECGQKDIELENDKFTFSNNRKGMEETKSRIDRACPNMEWHSTWPNSILQSSFANV